MSRRVLVYGDISPNVIDGSSTWLASIVEVLAGAGAKVDLLLKYSYNYESGILDRVLQLAEVSTIAPASSSGVVEGHTPVSAAGQAASLISDTVYDAVIVRGFDACNEFSRLSGSASFLWSYVTDLPFPLTKLSPRNINRLNRIAANSYRMLSQTESSRSYLESIAGAASGKTELIAPMIPGYQSSSDKSDPFAELRLVYSGKFAKDWRTLELLELPSALRARGVNARLDVVGNKFQKDPAERRWHILMENRLRELSSDADSGVIWHGGVPREESMKIISRSHVGIGWRTSRLDSSLEVSTKMLEYASLGVAPLVNRSTEQALVTGSDYPLYSNAKMDVDAAASLLSGSLGQLDALGNEVKEWAAGYSMLNAARLWRKRLDSLPEHRTVSMSTSRRRSLVVAAHDFKFMGELMSVIKKDARFEVSTDTWRGLHEHDEKVSTALVSNADTILCEWCGGNAVWYSNRKKHGERLIVRLHGFELRRGRWLSKIAWDNVDLLVLVSEYYREVAIAKLGLGRERTAVIPNMIDCDDLARPKIDGAEFNIGLLGYVPFLKRPDRALDLLEELRAVDTRFNLTIKGRDPWEYPHYWNSPVERENYLDFYGRIRDTPSLRDAVRVEPFGPEVANWYRTVGAVLSPSDHESFHLAPAEGMASGALPVVWNRAGAVEVFGEHFVFSSMSSMVEALANPNSLVNSAVDRNSLRQEARRRWGLESVSDRWLQVLWDENEEPCDAGSRVAGVQ